MKKFRAFAAIAVMFAVLASLPLSAQSSCNLKSESKFSILVGESNSYGIDVKTKKSSVFFGGVAGIMMNPHDNFIARLTLGYFAQSRAGSLSKKDEMISVDSIDFMPIQTFSGLYFSVSSPIEISLRHSLYFGAVIRIGRYGNGMTFSPGFYFGYLACKDLFPKSNMLVKFEPAISLNKIENVVAVDAMFHLRFNSRH